MNPIQKITDFAASRLRGVGSSDIPILSGLYTGYKETALTLWREKRGLAPGFEGNERARWGTALEPVVLARWVEDHYGADVAHAYLVNRLNGLDTGALLSNTECYHPERAYCMAHADLVDDSPYEDVGACIVEAKTSGRFAGRRREGYQFTGYDPDDLSAQGIPDAVYLQTQWQLYVYGIKAAFVVVLIDTRDYSSVFGFYSRSRDPSITDDLEKVCYILDGKTLPEVTLKATLRGDKATEGKNEYFSVKICKNQNTHYTLEDETRRKLNLYGPEGAVIGENIKIKVFDKQWRHGMAS